MYRQQGAGNLSTRRASAVALGAALLLAGCSSSDGGEDKGKDKRGGRRDNPAA